MVITFVVPSYNEEKLLPRCLAAIHLEAGRYQQLEYQIFVVDNNSTDHTSQIARKYGATIITESKRGVTHARNKGYKAVQVGEFIAFVDADTEIPFGWLQAALKAMDDDTVMVTGPIVYPEWGKGMRFMARGFYAIGRLCHRTVGPMCQGGNFMVRRSALDAIGGYPTSCDFYGEDTDFAHRIATIGKTKIVARMSALSSARRMSAQGVINTTLTYVINYFSVTLFGKPVHKTHVDYRT